VNFIDVTVYSTHCTPGRTARRAAYDLETNLSR